MLETYVANIDIPTIHPGREWLADVNSSADEWRLKNEHPNSTTPSVKTAKMMMSILCMGYFFSQRSSQLKYVRCQSTPFCGFSTQWFSSGKMSNWASMPRIRAALKADIP